MSATDDLWGDLPLDVTIRPPAVFLKEQASILTVRTRGLLRGEVSYLRAAPNLQAALDIVAPALQGYRLRLLIIEHAIVFYPLQMTDVLNGITRDAPSEDQYVTLLKSLLSSRKVHDAVGSLLSQVKAGLPSEAENSSPSA